MGKIWIEQINKFAPDKPMPIKLIIGNKTDLKREVSKEEAQKFADDNKFQYFETCAKKGKGVATAFDTMARRVISEIFHQQCEQSGGKVNLGNPNPAPAGGGGCRC